VDARRFVRDVERSEAMPILKWKPGVNDDELLDELERLEACYRDQPPEVPAPDEWSDEMADLRKSALHRGQP
jgi:hypothetical protein